MTLLMFVSRTQVETSPQGPVFAPTKSFARTVLWVLTCKKKFTRIWCRTFLFIRTAGPLNAVDRMQILTTAACQI
jgi:hypothetical protein